ncbi:AaceriAEL134Wp [[Ashbya] aceris (nom. inval.)]|nr:AaceriAEL134Wp [[Ashbya] aceris (nom. inval.)]
MRTSSSFGLVLWLLIQAVQLVWADVSVLKPEMGSRFSAKSGKAQFELVWRIDESTYPKADEIEIYNVTLCGGPLDKLTCMMNLANDVLPSDVKEENGELSLALSVDANIVADGMYMVQLTANAGVMGYTINYSKRFYLEDMKGPQKITATAPLDHPLWGEVHITAHKDGQLFDPTAEYASVPYLSQTARTRYAPMQTQPATKISATTWVNPHPVTSVSYFSVIRSDLLYQQTTITRSRTYEISLHPNFATPLPHPSTWYDPKERQTLSTRKVNLNHLSQR